MEKFIRDALAGYVECHSVFIDVNVDGPQVVAVVDLCDGKGLREFRITAKERVIAA